MMIAISCAAMFVIGVVMSLLLANNTTKQCAGMMLCVSAAYIIGYLNGVF